MTRDEKNVAMKLAFDVAKEDFIKAGEASSNIKKKLSQLGVDPSIIRRIAIATYEAEINLVIHSEGGAINVYIKPTAVEIYVEDQGPGIEDVNLAMTKGYSTASQKAREMGFGAGIGLPNMKRCSDDFDIESELGVGTNLKMVMKL